VAVKYYCPKCGRRFVDWGAEKLRFKCPSESCEEQELVLSGSEASDAVDAAHKEKRSKKRKAIMPPVSSDIDVPDLEDEFSDDVDIEVDEEVEDDVEGDILPVIADEDEPVVDEDVVVDVIVPDDEEAEGVFDASIEIEDEEVELEEE
jgi:hypothetical protein